MCFVKVWMYRKNLNPKIKISTQIFQIAKTVLIDEIRKEARRSNKYSFLKHFSLDTHQENGYNKLTTEELRIRIQHITSSLPPMRKRVFEMSRNENLTYKEISEKLSISVRTVDKHIELALRQIKPQLALFCTLICGSAIL